MQVDLAEPLEHLPEYATILQVLELVSEQELVEKDVTNVRLELRDVVQHVLVELRRILTFQGPEGEAAGVVDANVVSRRFV